MKPFTINRLPITAGMTTEALPDRGEFASGIFQPLLRPIAERSRMARVARETNVQVDVVPTRKANLGYTSFLQIEITGTPDARAKYKKALGLE
jgi:hypothetical protein